MGQVQLNNISLAFGDRPILSNVTFFLSSGDRFALTGVNGSGKSTLMKIIAGLHPPDSGTVTSQSDTRISYLPQSGVFHEQTTLLEEADAAFNHLKKIELEKTELEQRIAARNEQSAPDGQTGIDSLTEELLQEHHRLQELLITAGYYERDHKIRQVLTGLGFSGNDFEKPSEQFSGGWQMRIALAKVLLEQPDILLLDEPTNYLDIEARNWLESFLNRYPGGVLLVSHDRFFLDTIVTDVLELFMGTIKRYKGNYSEYEKKHEEEVARIKKEYEEQQKYIAKTEEFIERFRYKASKAKQVQSRVKELEKLKRVELPENMKTIAFHFPPAPHSGGRILTIEGLFRSYGENTVLNNIDFEVTRGERIAVTGKNGAGKSTLLRVVAGDDRYYQGTVRYGTDVSIGYFAQDHESKLTDSNTVLEEAEHSSPTGLFPYLRDILGGFLFRGDDINKKTSVLSGGEKSRLAIIKLLLRPANFLILDEPTNHLDIHSKDILLYALRNFKGAVLFVSHDRYFLEQTATKVLELTAGRHKEYPGDYRYYLWRKEKESEEAAGTDTDNRGTGPETDEKPAEKVNHEEDKRRKNERKRLRSKEKELLEKIEALEEESFLLESQLKDPAIYSDPVKASETQTAIENNKKEQEAKTQEWEKVELLLSSYETDGVAP